MPWEARGGEDRAAVVGLFAARIFPTGQTPTHTYTPWGGVGGQKEQPRPGCLSVLMLENANPIPFGAAAERPELSSPSLSEEPNAP